MRALFREPRLSSRAPRVSPPAPVRQRTAEPLTDAEQILALQRAAGNRAADRAIRRLTKERPAKNAAVRQVPDPGNLPKPPEEWLLDKEGAYRVGQALSPSGVELSSGTGSVIGQAGKSLGGVEADAVAGASLDAAGYGIGAGADLLTIAGKGGELHGNRKDARYAKDSGSRFWHKAARRQVRIKGADVGFAATKLVTSDKGKTADYGVSLAETAGHVGRHAASVTGMVTGAVALPIQVLSVLRDFRKLLKQGARLDRMRKRLYGHDTSVNVQKALNLKNDFDLGLAAAQQIADRSHENVNSIELQIRHYEIVRDVYRKMAQVRNGQLDDIPAGLQAEYEAGLRAGLERAGQKIKRADEQIEEARGQLGAAREDLKKHKQAVEEAEKAQQKADEAYKPMAAGVTEMAAEVKQLDQGQAPSLKALAYYARVKSAKGVTRRTIKVISGGLGVAAAIVGLIALVSGPGAVVLGPIGIALGAAGALLGLGLASQTGWRYLSKRWRLTEDAYTDTGKKQGDEESGKPIYKKIDGIGARLKATFSFRSKLYDAPGEDGAAKERKSHRKLMAEALWDYATNDKYEHLVRNEAWGIIKDLTGRTEGEILGPGSGDTAPNGATRETVLKGQKAAALKLFEDKLKSA